MGVPLFFRLLNKKYKIIRNNPDKTIRALYIDANCLLHPQCFTVLDLNKNLTNQKDLFKKMVQRIVEYIDYIIRLTNPTELVYIAIDGVAPLAKINQQRMRRFGYANNYRNDVYKKYGQSINESWSNIVITPGTQFMHDLHESLISYYKKHVQTNTDIKCTYKIIYDSYLTPGEGEHKILQHLKATTLTNEKEATIIYGLDADLIFLSMASQISNIYLLRESSQFKRDDDDNVNDNDIEQELCFADIDYAKQSINNEFNEYYTKFITNKHGQSNADMFGEDDHDNEMDNLEKLNKFDFVNDYIFICYFLGNDFLPHLPSIDIGMEGMDILFNAYMEVFQMLGRNLINLNNPNIRIKSDIKLAKGLGKTTMSIDNEFLILFVRLVASKEEDFFRRILPENLRRYRQRRCFETEQHKKIVWKIENLKDVTIKDVTQLGSGRDHEWKFRYYSHYFKTSEHMTELVDSVCQNYIEGLLWVARYYFESCSTWKWQYKFTHAPFLSDLIVYMKNRNVMTDYNVPYQEPVNIYTQLVSVVPSVYSDILPEGLKYLSSSVESPIIDLFPIKYEIDMINKTQLYKCVPMIPYLDVSRVDECIKKINLTNHEKLRTKYAEPFNIGKCSAGKIKSNTKIVKNNKNVI
jgi:5'-3' exonuclease